MLLSKSPHLLERQDTVASPSSETQSSGLRPTWGHIIPFLPLAQGSAVASKRPSWLLETLTPSLACDLRAQAELGQ